MRFEIGGQRRVEAGKEAAVFLERPADRLRFEAIDQRRAVGRRVGDVVASLTENIEHLDGALRRIEADGVRHLVVAPRIGRQHDGDALVGLGGSPQRDPGAGARDNGGDALVIARVNRAGIAKRGIGHLDPLERGDAGEDAAVQFRQHDMNREIGRRQPAVGFRPHLAGRAGQRHLQHRRIDDVERRAGAGIAARRKRGRVDDQIRRDPRDPVP